MQLGPKAEDVEKPVNPFVFFLRFILGAIAATYFVIVPIYMWLKDRIVPKGMPIWEKKKKKAEGDLLFHLREVSQHRHFSRDTL